MSTDLIKEVLQIPGLLKDIYHDLAKPGAEQAGKALGTIIGLGNTLLWPIALANEKSRIALEKNLEKYRTRLEKTPQEEIAEVTPEIGVPIAEKIMYVANTELSDMYIELLAKASIKSTASFAHPSFVNVINNLSPDEAILLKTIDSNPSLPFVEIRLHQDKKQEFNIFDAVFSSLSKSSGLAYPDNIRAYLSNFEGLGLLQIRTDITLAKQELYASLENESKERLKAILELSEPKFEIKFRRGRIDITPFGQLFLNACLTK